MANAFKPSLSTYKLMGPSQFIQLLLFLILIKFFKSFKKKKNVQIKQESVSKCYFLFVKIRWNILAIFQNFNTSLELIENFNIIKNKKYIYIFIIFYFILCRMVFNI